MFSLVGFYGGGKGSGRRTAINRADDFPEFGGRDITRMVSNEFFPQIFLQAVMIRQRLRLPRREGSVLVGGFLEVFQGNAVGDDSGFDIRAPSSGLGTTELLEMASFAAQRIAVDSHAFAS